MKKARAFRKSAFSSFLTTLKGESQMSEEAAQEPTVTTEETSPVPSAGEAAVSVKDGADSGTPSHTFNIFIGDLPANISETQLREHFETYGEIKTVNIIRDKSSGACKGYAFVHFVQRDAREKALLPENAAPMLGGQVARVKPSDEKTTLILTNAPMGVMEDKLRGELKALLVGIASDFRIEPKTPGCIALTFDSFDTANLAKKALMNAPLLGKQLTAAWQETKSLTEKTGGASNGSGAGSGQGGRSGAGSSGSGGSFGSSGSGEDSSSVTTLHISNISVMAGEDDLRTLFSRFGEVTRPVIVKNALGEKRGFGFVTLPDRDACVAAMRDLDQTEFFGQRIGVALAKATSGSASSTTRSIMGGGMGGGGHMGGRGGRGGGPDRTGRYDRGGDRGGHGGPGGRNDRSGPYAHSHAPPSYTPGAYPGPAAASYPPYMPYGMPWAGYPPVTGGYDPNAMAYGASQQSPYPYAYDPHMYAAAAAAAASGGYNPSAPPTSGSGQPPSQPPPRYY